MTILLLLAALPIHAQNTAEVRGAIADRTGAVLPGVAVTLTHKGSNQERRQATDGNGSYIFAALPNGEYLLKAELTGFKTGVHDGIALQGGQRINIDLLLEVGAINEEVTITEAVPLMRTTNAEISEYFR